MALNAPSEPSSEEDITEGALARAADLGRSLELYDATGVLVATDFIDLTDWPGGHPEVAAIIGLRESHASVQAPLPRQHARDNGSEVPEQPG